MVVELLSPGTEDEDLGRTEREVNQPPTKWQVYEQFLRIPYYVIFTMSSSAGILSVYKFLPCKQNIIKNLYLNEPKVWMPELGLGLGLWQGDYAGIHRLWLRWYDAKEKWISTEAEQERQRAERLAERLRELGINPDDDA